MLSRLLRTYLKPYSSTLIIVVVLQLVGVKDHDGMAFAIVND